MGKDAGVRWGINTVKGWFKGGKGGKGVKPPKAEGKPPRRVSEANKGGKGKPSKLKENPLDVFQKLIRVVKESRLNPLNSVEKP